MYAYTTPQKKTTDISAIQSKVATGNPLQLKINLNNPLQLKRSSSEPHNNTLEDETNETKKQVFATTEVSEQLSDTKTRPHAFANTVIQTMKKEGKKKKGFLGRFKDFVFKPKLPKEENLLDHLNDVKETTEKPDEQKSVQNSDQNANPSPNQSMSEIKKEALWSFLMETSKSIRSGDYRSANKALTDHDRAEKMNLNLSSNMLRFNPTEKPDYGSNMFYPDNNRVKIKSVVDFKRDIMVKAHEEEVFKKHPNYWRPLLMGNMEEYMHAYQKASGDFISPSTQQYKDFVVAKNKEANSDESKTVPTSYMKLIYWLPWKIWN